MMFQNKLQSQRGVSIFLVVIVLAVISGVALGLVRVVVTELQTQRGIENSVFTFFAAEAGIEQILYIGINIDISTCGDIVTCLQTEASNLGVGGVVSLPNGSTYEITIDGPGDNDCSFGAAYCATSFGSFAKGRRAIFIEK